MLSIYNLIDFISYNYSLLLNDNIYYLTQLVDQITNTLLNLKNSNFFTLYYKINFNKIKTNNYLLYEKFIIYENFYFVRRSKILQKKKEISNLM